MKTLSLVSAILISISLGLLFSCASKSQLTLISVMVDNTDKEHIDKPNVSELFTIASIDTLKQESLVNGLHLKIIPITQVDFNKGNVFKLPSVNYNDMNILVRRREIHNYIQDVQASLDALESHELNHSSIYIPFVQEMNRLAKTQGDHKYLLLYSDLSDNDPQVFNAYKNYNLPTDEIVKTLEKHGTLNSIDSVTVIVKYYPKDETDNIRFRAMTKVYKTIIEKNGGKFLFEF